MSELQWPLIALTSVIVLTSEIVFLESSTLASLLLMPLYLPPKGLCNLFKRHCIHIAFLAIQGYLTFLITLDNCITES